MAKCVLCSKPVGEFRDALSRREHEITGVCQACQDDIFSEPKHDGSEEVCPHCGSVVCYVAEIPGPIRCGNTGRVVSTRARE